jgi:DNA-binding transcriptional regulator YiaG
MHLGVMQNELTHSQIVKAAMETLGMNQPRFADELGVDQGTVSKWINGKANPSGPVMKLIDRLVSEHTSEAAE